MHTSFVISYFSLACRIQPLWVQDPRPAGADDEQQHELWVRVPAHQREAIPLCQVQYQHSAVLNSPCYQHTSKQNRWMTLLEKKKKTQWGCKRVSTDGYIRACYCSRDIANEYTSKWFIVFYCTAHFIQMATVNANNNTIATVRLIKKTQIMEDERTVLLLRDFFRFVMTSLTVHGRCNCS